MKILKNSIVAFSLILITLGLSCNEDIIESGMYSGKIPPEFIEVKSKVDMIIRENRSIIPAIISPVILWETAIIVDNHIEVEIKNVDNVLLVPSREMNSEIRKFGKLILKIDDINNPSDLYIYGIIPDNKAFLIDRKLKIDDLKDSGFNGLFWVSDLSFKPFAVFEYKNGKIDKKLRLLDKDESRAKLSTRDYWWCDYIALVQMMWEPENEEYVVCEVCDPLIEFYFDCVFIDEGDDDMEEFDDCVKFPWLCDGDGEDGVGSGDESGGGGVSDSNDDSDDEVVACKCRNDVFSESAFNPKWTTVGGEVSQQYWLQVVETNCQDGQYNAFKQHTTTNPTIYSIITEQDDAHEIINTPITTTTANGKTIQCGAKVVWSWNLIVYLQVGVNDLASGSFYYEGPQYMHIDFTVN